MRASGWALAVVASFFLVGCPAATPVTSCSIAITPPSTTPGEVLLTASSNGADCSLTVDGETAPAPCTFSGAALELGTGTHDVVLNVASGPSGPTSCMATVAVADDP